MIIEEAIEGVGEVEQTIAFRAAAAGEDNFGTDAEAEKVKWVNWVK